MAQIHDKDEVHLFLQKHLLHWFEALSLMDAIAEVIKYIGVLQSLLTLPVSRSEIVYLRKKRCLIREGAVK